MRGKFLDLLYSETRIVPNKFTIALGKLIRDARIEANISQGELAEKAYFKQSSISKIETGMRSLAAEDILYLSYALDKPIRYFFPKEFTEELGGEEATALEEELLLQARRLTLTDLQKLIAQARALADFEKNPPLEYKKKPTKEGLQEFENLMSHLQSDKKKQTKK